jgi:hypothetical protein
MNPLLQKKLRVKNPFRCNHDHFPELPPPFSCALNEKFSTKPLFVSIIVYLCNGKIKSKIKQSINY